MPISIYLYGSCNMRINSRGGYLESVDSRTEVLYV